MTMRTASSGLAAWLLLGLGAGFAPQTRPRRLAGLRSTTDDYQCTPKLQEIAQGFRALQGNDGNIRKFTINSIPEAVSVFPKAHTCFNRIDLPLYDSKKKLQKFLTMAVQMEATGFDID